jgi:hypothetical protein
MAWRYTGRYLNRPPTAGVPQRPWLLNLRSPERAAGKLLMGLGSHCLAQTIITQTSGPSVTSQVSPGPAR